MKFRVILLSEKARLIAANTKGRVDVFLHRPVVQARESDAQEWKMWDYGYFFESSFDAEAARRELEDLYVNNPPSDFDALIIIMPIPIHKIG